MNSHRDTLIPSPAPPVGVNATPPPAARAWIPIRSLGPRHRERIVAHLVALPERDRYLRFGYAATDGQIGKYVDTLDFERDEVFGIFNRRLELIATAHLANAPAAGQGGAPAVAEFGVSVLPHARGRGYGARLFERAVLHARNHGIERLEIQALSENTAMLRIARHAGAVVVHEGSESQASLRLPPETLATQVDEIVEQGAAEIDFQLKLQSWRVNEFLDAVSDLRALRSGKTDTASE